MNTYAVSLRMSGVSIDTTVKAKDPMTAIVRVVRIHAPDRPSSETITQLLVQCKKLEVHRGVK